MELSLIFKIVIIMCKLGVQIMYPDVYYIYIN